MAENLANELNMLAREDCDFLGGDGPALLDDYLGVPVEELSDDELPADNDQHYQEGTNHNNEYTELCVRACVCVCVCARLVLWPIQKSLQKDQSWLS